MKDLKQIMDSTQLTEFKAELEQQLDSIRDHRNSMKRMVLLCMLGEAVMAEISREEPEKFIEKLKDELNQLLEANKSSKAMQLSHALENSNVVRALDTVPPRLQEIAAQLNDLMGEYDQLLAQLIKERDSLPVCKL